MGQGQHSWGQRSLQLPSVTGVRTAQHSEAYKMARGDGGDYGGGGGGGSHVPRLFCVGKCGGSGSVCVCMCARARAHVCVCVRACLCV